MTQFFSCPVCSELQRALTVFEGMDYREVVLGCPSCGTKLKIIIYKNESKED